LSIYLRSLDGYDSPLDSKALFISTEGELMLRRIILTAVLVAGCAGVAGAAATDDVQAAAQKLVDSDNYSWTTTAEGGFGAGTTRGKTRKDGLTTLSISRQDNSFEVVIQGNKGAIKTEDQWKSASELAANAGDGGGGGGGFSPARFLTRMVQNFKSPASMAADVIPKLQKVDKTDDVYSADLPTDVVKQLIFPPGRRNGGGDGPEISNASGSIKFWIKDGMLSKVEENVKGTISFNGDDRDIDRTTTTEFKDVGSTTIEIPDEAKAKLEAPPATQP
jgi:hypothetical protein